MQMKILHKKEQIWKHNKFRFFTIYNLWVILTSTLNKEITNIFKADFLSATNTELLKNSVLLKIYFIEISFETNN